MLKADAQWTFQGSRPGPTPAPLVTVAAAAVSFGAFFAFVGWYDETGGRGWRGYAIPLFALAAGQGLGFPNWTWRKGVQLALAGALAVILFTVSLYPAFLIPPLLFLAWPGVPIGFAFGALMRRAGSGTLAGLLAFNPVSIFVLAKALDDLAPDAMFPAPGIRSFSIWGAIGGGLLALALTRQPCP